MYNANATYEENYANGPDARFLPTQHFPKVTYQGSPKYQFLGVPLHIPFGVPAGPLLNARFVKVALDAGFCLPTYKTVRSLPWKSNDWPNVLTIETQMKHLFSDQEAEVLGLPFRAKDYRDKELSISNSFGVPSQAPDIWAQDFKTLTPYSESPGHHVALSFQGSHLNSDLHKNAADAFHQDVKKTCALAMEAAQKTGFCLLEINLSCPNEASVPIYKNLKSAVATLKAGAQALQERNSNLAQKIKLIAKIGTMSDEDTNVFLSESASYIDGVSAINTVLAKIYNHNRTPALGSGAPTGGVCGHLIYEQGLRMMARLAERREKIGLKNTQLGLIGVGGVSTVEHFQSYRNTGADLVQAATGMMWNLELAQEIAQSLHVPFQNKDMGHATQQ